MEVIVITCPNCGAQIHNFRLGVVCEFCHSEIVLINNSIDESKIFNYIKRAKEYFEENDYDKSYEYYNRVLDIDADNLQAKEGVERLNAIPDPFVIGAIVEGKVIEIRPFGVLLEFSKSKHGLLHISKISKKRIRKISDVLSIGDIVKVKCIDYKAEYYQFSIRDL